MTLRERFKAWWFAYQKATMGYCEEHKLLITNSFMGCEECFVKHCREMAEEERKAYEVKLQHEAEVNAKAIVDEMEKRKRIIV